MTKPTHQGLKKGSQENKDRLAEIGKAGRWKKGTSGNPNGSPKKEHSITMHLRDELAKVGKDGKTKAQEIAEAMVAAAKAPVAVTGSSSVLRELLSRTEGSVPQSIGVDLNVEVNFIIGRGYEDKTSKDKGDSE